MADSTDTIDTDDSKKPASLAPLFDSLDEGVIIWTADRKLFFANNAARRITKLELVPGTPLPPTPMSVHVLDRNDQWEKSDALPVYRAFDGEDVQREDIRFIDPNGMHRWLSVSARRIHDENGALAYVMSALRDISVRKSRESKLEFMVESAKILSLDLDFKSRLTEKAKLAVPHLADWCAIDIVNDAGELERVTIVHQSHDRIRQIEAYEKKYPRDDSRPDSVYNVIQRQQPCFIKLVTEEMIRAGVSSEEQLNEVLALQLKSVMIIPIISNDKGLGAMTVAYAESGRTYDESDLAFFQEFCYHLSVVFDNARLFEEIAMRDKSKDIFLAALSHELRNPLAPIKSSLELLKLRESSQDIREELDIIEHQFDHMSHLLNDLLDVTRFTQDRISLSSRPVELHRLIDRAQRATDALVRHADITLHFAYPSLPLSVNADEMRLEQAVSNLLSNAVKFTPAGGSIWVDLERDDDHALIRVRDNGAGIEPADLPNIFDMYYQGVNSGPVNSGLGIGLLLVKRIINMHGGSVEAKSQGRGSGSEFIIRMPLAEAPVPETEKQSGMSLAHSLRILVVDDNAPAADSLVRLLNKLGARAQAVYSAHEALGSERLNEVDLFLLDVGMPHMDGYELVSALRKQGISAPIVALTGYGLADDKKRAHDAGFSSHLTKPVGIAELNDIFKNVLPESVEMVA